MRFALARISHATNTFARGLTNLQDFQSEELISGSQVIDRYALTSTVLGGALEAARSQEIEIVPLLSASAASGGTVSDECFHYLCQELCSALRSVSAEVDALVLDMHGAMVSERFPAADERILQKVRAILGENPIAVVMDSHANLTPGVVALADIVLGYRTYPHVDMAERGHEAVSLLARICHGELRIEKAFEQVSSLIPLNSQYTGRSPMADIHDLSSRLQSENDLVSISVFGGFPFADVEHAGASILALAAEGDEAARAVSIVSQEVWERRNEFTVPGSNVEEAIHDAMAAHEGPIVLADLGDNPGGGAPGDGTTLLWALLDLGARDASLAVIADEQAVEACISAGIDSRVEIPIGGRRDTRHGYPIDVRGKVKSITDGKFTVDGPMATGLQADMGRTVVLDIEARHEGIIEVVLTERRFQPCDLNVFRHAGIEPTQRKILALKSSVHFRAAFEPIAKRVYEVITPGITTPDPAFFEYQNVRRPIFPLDAM